MFSKKKRKFTIQTLYVTVGILSRLSVPRSTIMTDFPSQHIPLLTHLWKAPLSYVYNITVMSKINLDKEITIRDKSKTHVKINTIER